MADAAAKRKQVPDGMTVRNSLGSEEEYSHRIEQSSCQQPKEPVQRHDVFANSRARCRAFIRTGELQAM
jgi:hypothetical protein